MSLNPFFEPQDFAPNWVGRRPTVPIADLRGGQKYLDLVKRNETGRRGFFEEQLDTEAKDIPWLGSWVEIPTLIGVTKTARKLHNEEEVTDEELLKLNHYLEYQRRKVLSTPAAKAVDVIQNSISLGLEIASTAVLSGLLLPEPVTTALGAGIAAQTTARVAAGKAARKATHKFVQKALGKTAAKFIGKGSKAAARSFAVQKGIGEAVESVTKKAVSKRFGPQVSKYLSKIVGVGAELETIALTNQLINPNRTIRSIAERRLVDAISDGDETVAASVAKGILDLNFEYASEFMGPYLGSIAKRLLPNKLVKLVGQNFLYNHIAQRTGTTGSKAAWNILNTMAINGMVEEMAEERAGDFLRGLFGVTGKAGLRNAIKQSWPSGEQFAVEAVAFSVLPLMANSLSRISGGTTSGEYAANLDVLRSLGSAPDVFAKTETDLKNEARVLNKKLNEENQPWYIDTQFDFLKNIFGEERRGTVQSMLTRQGVSNLRRVHDSAMKADPKNPDAGIDAIAETLSMLQRVQMDGIWTEKDVNQFNDGVKSGDIIRRQRGNAVRFFANRDALSNEDTKKLAKQTGISYVQEIGDVFQERIGRIVPEDFVKSWDALNPTEKNNFGLRWNSKDMEYLQNKYEFYRGILGSQEIEDIEIFESMPFVAVGTADQFSNIAGYEIDNITDVYDTVEGRKRYALNFGAMSSPDGTEIDVSTHAANWMIAEDVLESKLKQFSGLDLFPEAQTWLNGIRSDLLEKGDKATNDEGRILNMLQTPQGRFEFFNKAYNINKLGYDVDADRLGKIISGYEVPDMVHNTMLSLVGLDLVNAISNVPIEGPARGPGQERVQEIITERPAGGTQEARRIVSEAQENELVNRLGQALQQDMRPLENRQAVQSILDEMDRTGTTFALESALGAENEFADLKRAVQTGSIKDIATASRHFLLRVPGKIEQRPKLDDRPETPEQFQDVFNADDLRRVAPSWLTGDLLKEWIENYPNIDAEGIVNLVRQNPPTRPTVVEGVTATGRGRILSEEPIPLPSSAEMEEQLRNAPSRLLARSPEGTIRPSPGGPFSVSATGARLDLAPDELEPATPEDISDAEKAFGKPVAATLAEAKKDLNNEQKVIKKIQGRDPFKSWEMQDLAPGRIDEQVTLVVSGGMFGALNRAEALARNTFRNADIVKMSVFPTRITGEGEIEFLTQEPKDARDRMRWVNDQTKKGTSPIAGRVTRMAFAENAPEAWVVVVDFVGEERLAYPAQRLLHAIRTGFVPQGRTKQTTNLIEVRDGVFEARRNIDSSDIISQLDQPIETTDFFRRGEEQFPIPESFQAVAFPITAVELQEMWIGQNDPAGRQEFRTKAFELHDWLRRNRIRKLGIFGLDSIIDAGTIPVEIKGEQTRHGKKLKEGDTVVYPNEELRVPQSFEMLQRLLVDATSPWIETAPRGPQAPPIERAAPIEITPDVAADLQARLRDPSFSLAVPEINLAFRTVNTILGTPKGRGWIKNKGTLQELASVGDKLNLPRDQMTHLIGFMRAQNYKPGDDINKLLDQYTADHMFKLSITQDSRVTDRAVVSPPMPNIFDVYFTPGFAGQANDPIWFSSYAKQDDGTWVRITDGDSRIVSEEVALTAWDEQVRERARQLDEGAPPSVFYENISVNKGLGSYEEQKITLPFAVPGQHGSFTDPNLAGWFRGREYIDNLRQVVSPLLSDVNYFVSENISTGTWDYSIQQGPNENDIVRTGFPTREAALDDILSVVSEWPSMRERVAALKEGLPTPAGTYEVNEIQSQLFQKNKQGFLTESRTKTESDIAWLQDEFGLTRQEATEHEFEPSAGFFLRQEADFLNNLLKDERWVSVFQKAIMQNLARRGLKRVRFPTGETAAKAEGHEALADRITYLRAERRLAIAQNLRTMPDTFVVDTNVEELDIKIEYSLGADGRWRRTQIVEGDRGRTEGAFAAEAAEAFARQAGFESRPHARSLAEIDSEISRIKTQGIEKLAPIEAFYQQKLQAILQRDRDDLREVTDLNGNTWFETDITSEDATREISFALGPLTPAADTLDMRVFDAIRRFNNNRTFSDDESRNFTRQIRQALAGNENSKEIVWRNLTAEDKAAFRGLLEPESARRIREQRDQADETEEISEDIQLGFQFDTSAMSTIDNLMEDLDPAFRGGAAGFHKLMLEQNRELRAIQFEETAFIDRMNDRLGLDGARRDLPPLHQERAGNMLAGVGAELDGSNRIPVEGVSRDQWITPEQYNQEWDAYIKANDLDMPTSAQVRDEIRQRYDDARNKANALMNDFTEGEWIRFLEDYITHDYKRKSPQDQEEAIRRIAEDARQAQERRIPTYEQAAADRNLFPITMNALQLYRTWNNTVWAAARNKSLVSVAAFVRDGDGAPIVIPFIIGDRTNVDQLISDKVLRENLKHLAAYLEKDFDASADPAAEIAKLVGDMNEEEHGYTTLPSPLTKSVKHFLVRKGTTEAMMKNIIHYGRYDNRLMKGLERFNAWSKFMMLSFSGFHPFALLESLTATFGVNLQNPAFHIPSTYKNMKSLVQDMKNNPDKYLPWLKAGLMVDIGNPDVKLGIIENDIQNWIDHFPGDDLYSKTIKNTLKGFQGYKHFIDKWLWHRFHPAIKMYSAEFVFSEWQQLNPDASPELEQETRKQIAEYINPAFGGLDWDQYTWATPQARQWLHALFFAPDWSFSAAQISGLTRLPVLRGMHATRQSPLMTQQQLRKYWPAMTAIVLFGIPNLVQLAIYGASKVLGGGDPDDVPFTFMNEPGRRTHIDFTPVFRTLPGNTGDASGERRIYMRWGKQAYEIFEGWLGDPKMVLRKSSSVFRQAWETVTGTSVTGWDLPFKDDGWMGVIVADGSVGKSRVGLLGQKFLPISLTSLAQGKPTAFIAPTSKGVSKGGVVYSMIQTLEAYIDKNALPPELRPLDLRIVVGELIEAARRNGIDPEIAYRQARGAVASKYYKKFFEALNKDDAKAMDAAAEKVIMLNKGLQDFNRSMESRFAAITREFTPELQEAVAESFQRASAGQ